MQVQMNSFSAAQFTLRPYLVALAMGRPIRGSRQSAFFPVDPNPSLSSLDSAFQLQEYISLLARLDPHDVERIVAIPGKSVTEAGGEKDAEKEKEKQAAPEDDRVAVDEACWIYEQLRRLAQDLTHPLITTLQQECTRQSCPEMKAGEWLYLCVAHGNSGAMEHCCAIDYIVHTLDSATALLNSPRAFPSRISIPSTSHRHFPSLARRLGRIFAHAYHHHRDAFESAEAESALYARFLALSRRFELVPAEFLVIPPRAAQLDSEEAEDVSRDVMEPVTLLTRPGSEEPAPAPTPSPPPASASPRIGGRSRTDTMYLTGDFITPPQEGSPSPRRGPSPMARTLFAEQRQEHEKNVEKEVETVKEMAKVVARDFAVRVPAVAVEEVEAEVRAEAEAEAEAKVDPVAAADGEVPLGDEQEQQAGAAVEDGDAENGDAEDAEKGEEEGETKVDSVLSAVPAPSTEPSASTPEPPTSPAEPPTSPPAETVAPEPEPAHPTPAAEPATPEPAFEQPLQSDVGTPPVDEESKEEVAEDVDEDASLEEIALDEKDLEEHAPDEAAKPSEEARLESQEKSEVQPEAEAA